MISLLLTAMLLSFAVLLTSSAPFFSVAIVLAFCVRAVISDFHKSPVRSMFVLSYTALFLVGVFFQLLLSIPFRDKFGVIGNDILYEYLYLATGFISIILVFSKLMDVAFVKSEISGRYIFSYEKMRSIFLLYPFVMFLVSLLFVLDYGGISNIVNMSRVDLGESRGGESIIALYVAYLMVPAYFIAGMLKGRLQEDKFRFFLFVVACIFFSVILFFVFRIRTFIVAHLFSYFMGSVWSALWIADDSSKLREVKVKGKYASLIKFALFLTVLIVVGAFFRFQRGAIENDSDRSYDLDFLRSVVELTFLGGDLGYHLIVMRVIQFANSGVLDAGFNSLIRIFLTFVPNGVFFDKPIDPQIVIGSLFDSMLGNFTVPPGIIGDFYMTYMDWWPPFVVIFSVMLWFFDRNKSPYSVLFYGSIFSTVFHFVRGASSNSVLIFLIIFVGSCLIARFIEAKKYE